jgi:hypothetical protein
LASFNFDIAVRMKAGCRPRGRGIWGFGGGGRATAEALSAIREKRTADHRAEPGGGATGFSEQQGLGVQRDDLGLATVEIVGPRLHQGGPFL